MLDGSVWGADEFPSPDGSGLSPLLSELLRSVAPPFFPSFAEADSCWLDSDFGIPGDLAASLNALKRRL